MRIIISLSILLSSLLFTAEGFANRQPHVVTMWWLFFNNPDACTADTSHGAEERCGPVDVFGQAFLDSVENGDPDPSLIAPNLATNLAVVYATGARTSRNGRVTLTASAYLSDDDPNVSLNLSSGSTVVDPLGFSNGFENTGAEIHVVVRDHGDAITGQFAVQALNFLEPNCSDPVLLWVGGDNICKDIQAAVFAPGEQGVDIVFDLDHLTTIAGATAELIRNGDMVQVIVRTTVPTENPEPPH